MRALEKLVAKRERALDDKKEDRWLAFDSKVAKVRRLLADFVEF